MTGTGANGRRRAEPAVALVHDNFAGPTGMGVVLNHHARWVLEAGWRLYIVGDNVADDLRAAARFIPATRPRGLAALPEHLEWCRRARAALTHVRADIVHVHSPLLADRGDIHTAHFISRPAFARGIREPADGLEGALRRAQGWATRTLDDRLYRRAQPRTYLSFVSEFLREEFKRHYGPPLGGWIFSPPAPPWRPARAEDRARAREAFGVREGALVVGYLGGSDPRKGFEDVLTLTCEADIHLLFAGPGSERMTVGGRPGLGFVDVPSFLSACDVLAAPARFDSAPVAVLEGLAQGVPVVTTPTSGWATAIERHGCGVVWRETAASLAAACKRAASAPAKHCRAAVGEFAGERQRTILLEAYEQILALGRPWTHESQLSRLRRPA
jgi:glycosyltransferase involved in cell wall biosynthesis